MKLQNATRIPEFVPYLVTTLRCASSASADSTESSCIRCFSSNSAATLFTFLRTRAFFLEMVCVATLCLRLKKSFRFPSVPRSCLFKLSFLVMKCCKTLMTAGFTNCSCQSSPSLNNEGISFGWQLSFVFGVSLRIASSVVHLIPASCYERRCDVCSLRAGG